MEELKLLAVFIVTFVVVGVIIVSIQRMFAKDKELNLLRTLDEDKILDDEVISTGVIVFIVPTKTYVDEVAQYRIGINLGTQEEPYDSQMYLVLDEEELKYYYEGRKIDVRFERTNPKICYQLKNE